MKDMILCNIILTLVCFLNFFMDFAQKEKHDKHDLWL